jgi:hypothetical protein
LEVRARPPEALAAAFFADFFAGAFAAAFFAVFLATFLAVLAVLGADRVEADLALRFLEDFRELAFLATADFPFACPAGESPFPGRR